MSAAALVLGVVGADYAAGGLGVLRGNGCGEFFVGVNFVYFAIRRVQKDVKGLVVLNGVIGGMIISNRPFSLCNDTFKCQRNGEIRMDILVTGGAGFIGSNLVSVLIKEHGVTVLDNFHTGSADNLKDLKDKITIIDDSCGNISNRLSNSDPDVIFHLGIPSSSPMYKENPMLVGSAINDAISVFEFAKNSGAKVVFASSSSLYNGLPTPNREDMDVMVTDYYTEARLGIERVAELYHQLYGIDLVGLRFFSVYGPNERAKGIYANIVSQFLWEMQDGKTPVIYGDGEQTRDFTFVNDVVRACILAMEKDVSGVFNVGTGVSHSFNDVVVTLNGVLGTDIEPQHIENPVKNYVAHTLADPTKVKAALGFRSEYSLEEGIREIA